jgi:hypothetical protein
MTIDAKTLAKSYFGTWQDKDFEALRALLADDVTFTGPLGSTDGADDCLRGLQGMAERMDDIVIHTVVAGSDVVTWYDLHMWDVEPVPTANWSHVEGGRIAAIRATFDPRPMLEASDE